MGTIHIGIGHDNDLVITELRNIEIISVALGKTTSKGIDHGLDLSIGEHLVNTCLLYIQDLTSDRQDCLISSVTGCFCTATRRISLYDKNFTFGSIPGFTVCQLSIGINGKFLLRQQISLCLFLCLTDPGRLFCTADNAFQCSRFLSK